MAKIAIAIGFAALGAVTAGLGLFPAFFGSTLAAGGAGSAIFGGMLGLSVGSTIGSAVFPGHLPNQYGPRLNDLSVNTSANGAFIPFGWGICVFGGNIIWSPGLVEHSTTTTHGGGFSGGPKVRTTTYSYTVSFAIAFGEGPGLNGTGADRTIAIIYMDAKVIFQNDIVIDRYGPQPDIYNGTDDQMPDPTIQAALGVDSTPAFRGLIYAVFTDFPLDDFGNRLGVIRGIIRFGNNAINYIVQTICNRCGIADSDIDVSALAALPISGGFLVSRASDGRTLLGMLGQARFFDVIESDFKLKGIPRGGASVMTIDEADLGLAKDSAKITENLGMEQELSQTVQVTFVNLPIADAGQGQTNKQEKRRSSRVISTANQTLIEFPMSMHPTEARQIADRILYLQALERRSYAMNLGRMKYAVLDPGDVCTFTLEGVLKQQRLLSSGVGQDFTIPLAAVSEDPRAYTSVVQGSDDEGWIPPPSPPPHADTLKFFYDIPYLQDEDASTDRTQSGFYWVLTSDQPLWPGGVLYYSIDDSLFDVLDSTGQRTQYGITTNALGDPPEDGLWCWDNVNTLNIVMTNGTLAGSTDLQVLENSKNALIVAGEVIQFVNCVREMDGSYTISRLLRGRRNTEYAAYGHGAGESVVAPLTGMSRSDFDLNVIGQERWYKAVTVGQDPGAVTPDEFTLAGNDLKPASPVHIKGTRDGSHNLTVHWHRRTRYGGLGLVGPTPLHEDSEAYSVDIMSGGTVVRTIAWTGSTDSDGLPTVPYTAAQQIADFGSTQSVVDVKVYQISAQVGRGFPGEELI